MLLAALFCLVVAPRGQRWFGITAAVVRALLFAHQRRGDELFRAVLLCGSGEQD
jgi:hypothetical protein